MKPIILKRWIEVEPTMLTDDKQKSRIEHFVFVHLCETRQGPKTGRITTRRSPSVVVLAGSTRDEADQKLLAYCSQPDVKLLEEDEDSK